ncbi:uncharacterized protein LOC132194326 [Neocloeon triangulifer]|uniref:uncharacterized protein LOC132194326 n=1 Tax=Neocloeon triangulifer TaxID=2078957 RepID=UPI00286EB63F|nr:uncharacterized protein LOC132194326 [Neocloeon triangulifer]
MTNGCDLPKLALLVLVLLHWTSDVVGIKCFQCSSQQNDSGCAELGDIQVSHTTNSLAALLEEKNRVEKALSYYKDCEDSFGGKEPFCRKMQQTIYARNNLRVVIRSCGWNNDSRDCYHFENKGHAETVCQCFEDGCNAAPRVTRGVFLVLVALLTSTWLR